MLTAYPKILPNKDWQSNKGKLAKMRDARQILLADDADQWRAAAG